MNKNTNSLHKLYTEEQRAKVDGKIKFDEIGRPGDNSIGERSRKKERP